MRERLPLALKVVTEPDGEDGVMISFQGSLTESSELDGLVVPSGKKLSFDLSGLKSINSIGIRQFMQLMDQIKDCPEIYFHRCTKPFVDQINLVHNFLPPHAKVKSFFVPYYDPQGDEEKQMLFIESIAYTRHEDQLSLRFPEVLNREGKAMELDVSKERYFHFLKFHG